MGVLRNSTPISAYTLVFTPQLGLSELFWQFFPRKVLLRHQSVCLWVLCFWMPPEGGKSYLPQEGKFFCFSFPIHLWGENKWRKGVQDCRGNWKVCSPYFRLEDLSKYVTQSSHLAPSHWHLLSVVSTDRATEVHLLDDSTGIFVCKRCNWYFTPFYRWHSETQQLVGIAK